MGTNSLSVVHELAQESNNNDKEFTATITSTTNDNDYIIPVIDIDANNVAFHGLDKTGGLVAEVYDIALLGIDASK